jgi:hypothetical protein
VSVARTFNGRSWRHVVLLLHPVDRNASAILQQGREFNTAPEGAQNSRTQFTHLNVTRVSGIQASGPLVIGVSLLRMVKWGRQSLRHDLFGLDLVRDISLCIAILSYGGSGLARREKKN